MIHATRGYGIDIVGNEGCTVAVEGGEIYSDGDFAIRSTTAEQSQYVSYSPSTVSITGGSIHGATAVYVADGNVSISGENTVIEGTGESLAYPTMHYSSQILRATGDAIMIESKASPFTVLSDSKLTIYDDPTIRSTYGRAIGYYKENGATTLIPVTVSSNGYTLSQGYKWQIK